MRSVVDRTVVMRRIPVKVFMPQVKYKRAEIKQTVPLPAATCVCVVNCQKRKTSKHNGEVMLLHLHQPADMFQFINN